MLSIYMRANRFFRVDWTRELRYYSVSFRPYNENL